MTSLAIEPPVNATEEERAYYALQHRAYGLLAPVYEFITAPLRAVRAEVATRVGIGPDDRVLDVATGTGAQARAFAAQAGEVIGIDQSESMLRIARRKSSSRRLSFRRGDAAALPFPDHDFDAACISYALHEMPESVRRRVLGEMVRVTRPGGTVAVVDYGRGEGRLGAFADRFVALYEPETYRDFVRSDLRAALAQAGIAVHEDFTRLHGIARIVIGTV